MIASPDSIGTEAEQRAEIAALKAELADMRAAQARSGETAAFVGRRASRFGWLVLAGRELDDALTVLISRIASGERPSSPEMAAVLAALVRRVIRVGLIAFMIALLPLTVAIVQTALLSKQNNLMAAEQLAAWQRDRLRTVAVAEGFQMRLNELVRVFRIEWDSKRSTEPIASIVRDLFSPAPNLSRQIEASPELLAYYPEIHKLLHGTAIGLEHVNNPLSPLDDSPPSERREDESASENWHHNRKQDLRDIEITIIQGVIDYAQTRLDTARDLIQAERDQLIRKVSTRKHTP